MSRALGLGDSLPRVALLSRHVALPIADSLSFSLPLVPTGPPSSALPSSPAQLSSSSTGTSTSQSRSQRSTASASTRSSRRSATRSGNGSTLGGSARWTVRGAGKVGDPCPSLPIRLVLSLARYLNAVSGVLHARRSRLPLHPLECPTLTPPSPSLTPSQPTRATAKPALAPTLSSPLLHTVVALSLIPPSVTPVVAFDTALPLHSRPPPLTYKPSQSP